MRNSFDIVRHFESTIAEYTGAKYAVAVDCCTNGIFLSMKYRQLLKIFQPPNITISIPNKTYISVAMAAIHAGYKFTLQDYDWVGAYHIMPLGIIDAAKRFRRNMFRIENAMFSKDADLLMCLSFHAKKHINIGRGGMILTNNIDAYEWLRRACYDGREGLAYPKEIITQIGWHMYMTPEQAARGLQLFEARQEDSFGDLQEDYPRLSNFDFVRNHENNTSNC